MSAADPRSCLRRGPAPKHRGWAVSLRPDRSPADLRTEVPPRRDLRLCCQGRARVRLDATKSVSAGLQARRMQGGIEMRRRTFDALATMAGLVLAVVLAIGGGLLLWGH